MIAACLAGLIAGVIHVFMGPDHLAALAPMSLQARRKAWSAGLRWGLGHAAGVLVIAGLAFGFRQLIDLEAVGSWGERLVGATLVVLGIWGFRSLFRNRLHAHVHEHDGERHVHFHVHGPNEIHSAPGSHVHTHAAFWVGTLHGLAGTAHLLGILPSLALPSAGLTAGYLASFALGTVAAMVAFSAAVGLAAPGSSERGLLAYRWALGAASGLCAMVGVAWIVLPLLGIELP